MNIMVATSNKKTEFIYWALGIGLLALSLSARVLSYKIETSDYKYPLTSWSHALSVNGGLSAFHTPFSDYAPMYLYFMKVLTFIPVSSLYSIKSLSFIFDVLIAVLSCLILKRVLPDTYKGSKLFFAFAIMLSIPTVAINSSLWGQCDAIYAAGVLATLYFIFCDRPIYAVVAFSLALCMKLQAIFFIPVLVGYLLKKGRAFLSLGLIPVIFFVSVIPALMSGGRFSYWGLIYLNQAKEYSALNMSSASIFSFFSSVSAAAGHVLTIVGILLAGVVASLVVYAMFFVFRKISVQNLFLISIASVLLIPFVLPHMHDRYFYLADVISVLYALYNPRHWYVAALIVLGSFLSYMPYLSGPVYQFQALQVDLRFATVIMAAAGILVVFFLVRQIERKSTL